jgi:hypothetical protein
MAASQAAPLLLEQGFGGGADVGFPPLPDRVMTGLPTRRRQAGNTGHPVPGPIRPAATAAPAAGCMSPGKGPRSRIHHIQGRPLISVATGGRGAIDGRDRKRHLRPRTMGLWHRVLLW